jgi:hypothetical protein
MKPDNASRPETFNLISVSSGYNGLAFRLWGAIGVITKLLRLVSMGPPQLREYPVDPVGVDTIKPSAQ